MAFMVLIFPIFPNGRKKEFIHSLSTFHPQIIHRSTHFSTALFRSIRRLGALLFSLSLAAH